MEDTVEDIDSSSSSSSSNDNSKTETVIDLTQKDPAHNGHLIIHGVDPGAVNCGICKYDVTLGKVVDMKRVSFRESHTLDENRRKKKQDTDLGNANLIESISQYILVEKAEDFAGSQVFIEDQQRDNKEVLSVQHTFQALMGKAKCVPVSPHAIKAHFSDYFPAKPGVHRNSEEQYRYDKNNAITYGRQFIPKKIRQKYELENPKKKDDGYDAYWVARFAAERLIDPESGERITLPPKKRKRNEPNKRPRSAIQTTEEREPKKRATSPKTKTKTKTRRASGGKKTPKK